MDNISTKIYANEILCIVGTSGSGKSTFLRIISGLENPTTGRISLSENRGKKIGFVFQDNSLYPWMTVQENILFPLSINLIDPSKGKSIADYYSLIVGLNPEVYLSKYPSELSGGEKRRVSIAMNLAFDPEVMLMDEPTSSLDDLNKFRMQETIQNIWLTKKSSFIIVTHDIEEAIFLGSRIFVFKEGKFVENIQIIENYPRTSNFKNEPEFLKLKEKIKSFL